MSDMWLHQADDAESPQRIIPFEEFVRATKDILDAEGKLVIRKGRSGQVKGFDRDADPAVYWVLFQGAIEVLPAKSDELEIL